MTEYWESRNSEIAKRRERVFLILAGIFLGTLAMLNILGISRFINLFSIGETTFSVAVGVLPYPVTFLCTDLISELYGKKRAQFVVWVGVLLNFWVVFILWLGGVLPGSDAPEFFYIRSLTFGAVTASMIAYITAQFTDVYMFHFWKRLTKGKHLWLRNNGSTLVSQMVDTVAVILITHYFASALPVEEGRPIIPQLLTFIGSGYVFKLVVALLDTGPVYLAVHYLSNYLELDPMEGYNDDNVTD